MQHCIHYLKDANIVLCSSVIGVVHTQIAFTRKKDFGTQENQLKWATAQRTIHGLQPAATAAVFRDMTSYNDLNQLAEEARRRAEIARYVQAMPLPMTTLNNQQQLNPPCCSSLAEIWIRIFVVSGWESWPPWRGGWSRWWSRRAWILRPSSSHTPCD